MATPDEHLDQARDNLALAQYLLRDHANEPTYVQWAVTVTFYCAVHCIQAHLLRLGHNPRSHTQRGALIADMQSGVPIDVQTACELLYQRSRAARYELATFDPTIVSQRLVGYYLAKIAAFVGL